MRVLESTVSSKVCDRAFNSVTFNFSPSLSLSLSLSVFDRETQVFKVLPLLTIPKKEMTSLPTPPSLPTPQNKEQETIKKEKQVILNLGEDYYQIGLISSDDMERSAPPPSHVSPPRHEIERSVPPPQRVRVPR